jgi:hypothetical protein
MSDTDKGHISNITCIIEFDDVLREIEVGWDISEGNYDILRYYRDEYKDLLIEVERLREVIRKLQQDTLEVASDWFDSDENEWRRLEQALGLPLTPLSWEGDEE